jgi:hypothetical protein
VPAARSFLAVERIMSKKGAQSHGRRRVLDEREAARVRRLYHQDRLSMAVLAARFNVSQKTISDAIARVGAYSQDDEQ